MCQSESGVKVFTPLSTKPSTGKELCGWVRMAETGSLVSGDHGRTLNRSMKCYAAAAAAKSLQSCPTLRPHRQQPTRLLCPWDSPGKNTVVGCHCLLQCMKVKVKSLSCVRLLATPLPAAYQAPPHPWDFPGKSTGVGCHCLQSSYGQSL